MSDERDDNADPKGRDRRQRRDDSSNRPASGRPSSGRPSSGKFGAPRNNNDRAARDGKPGERKPFSRDGKPGERKPFSRDGKPGERKPFSRDGKPGERKPFSRDGKPGERKPFSRDGKPGERKPYTRDGKPGGPRPEPREEEFPRFRPSEEQRKAIREQEPELENRFAGKELDRAVLRDLSTLSEDNAMVVGRHLEAASFYAEIDPPRALQHAIAAKNRASRLAVVRETVGIMAYVNQDFTLALSELRTAQRISGSKDQVALIIDCLRGLDRSSEGLKIARELDRASLPREAQVDLAIVLSGIRLDRSEPDRAYAELQIPQLDPTNATPECVALFDANAEVLEGLGRSDEAAQWRRYARLTEAHFAPDETIEFHTEYLEQPTDVTEADMSVDDDETVPLTATELSDLVEGITVEDPAKDAE